MTTVGFIGSGNIGGTVARLAVAAGYQPDPRGLEAYGAAVRRLLSDPEEADRMGRAARAHISRHYVGDLHLLRYEQLFSAMVGGPG